MPAGLSNVVAVAGGGDHSLALRSDGTVVAWGYNSVGQTTAAGLSNVVAVAGGGGLSLALRSDGTMAAWDDYGQTPVPAGLSNVVAVAVAEGGSHSLALVGWGQAPFVSRQPVSGVGYFRGRFVLSAEVTGQYPLSFQWRHCGTNLPGATQRWLVLTNLESSAAGPYSLVASNALGSVVSSNAWLSVQEAPIVPPSDLTATFSNNVVILTWQDNSTNETGFVIQVWDSGCGCWVTVGNVGAGVTSFTYGGGVGAGTVIFRVIAVNGSGSSGSGNTVTVVPSQVPAAPANLAVAWTGSAVRLSWQDNSTNETSFQIQRKLGTSGAWSLVASVGANVSQADDIAVVAGQRYYYRVRALNSGLASAFSLEAGFQVPVLGGTLEFVAASMTVGESAGAVSLAVRRFGGSQGSVAVNYATVSGTATAGADFAATSGTLSWAAGDTAEKTISVPIYLDAVVEGNETFSVRLSGATGLAVVGGASNAVVTILNCSRPAIVRQPQSQSVATGGSVALSVLATNSGYTFSTSQNGTDLEERQWFDTRATEGVVTISYDFYTVPDTLRVYYEGARIYDSGEVSGQSTVTAPFGPGTSTVVEVVINEGGGRVGTAWQYAASCTAALLNYQWQQAGVGLVGATNAGLSLTNVGASQAGDYRVVIVGDCSSVTSAVATVTVVPPAPPIITSQPQSRTNAVGTLASFSVTATGSLPFSYQWRFNGALLAGATNASFTRTNAQLGDAGNYAVVVTNSFGSATSTPPAVLTVLLPVEIGTPPVSQTVLAGGNASLSVTASGSAPLSYQWRFNGGNLAGATGATLTLTNVQWAQAGSYVVVVSNPVGSVTSAPPAVLTVNSRPIITQQPVSQTNTAGITATFGVTVVGTSPFGYQWRFQGANLTEGGRFSGARSSLMTISNLQTNDAGSYSVVVSNAYGSVTSAVVSLTVPSGPVPKADYRFGGTLASSVGTPPLLGLINAGQAFGVQVVDGAMRHTLSWPAGAGLRLQPTAGVFSSGQYSVVLLVKFDNVSSWRRVLDFKQGTSDNGFYLYNGALELYPSSGSSSVCVASQTWQQLVLTRDATGQMAVYCDGVVRLSFTDSAGNAVASGGELRFFKDDGTEETSGAVCRIRVYATALSAAEVAALDRGGTVAVPSMTVQPQSQTVAVGSNAVFTASATSLLALSYQWQRKGTNLPGANNPTLTLPSVQLPQAGDYRVVVTNSAGAVTSQVATLTVYVAPPVIITPPQSRLVGIEHTVTFSADLGGSPPFQYQWLFNGTNLPGATNAALVLSNVQTNQAGAYTLAVWNSVGAVTSSPSAVLTVATVWIDLVSLSANRLARLRLYGEAGTAYEIQVSTNLATWTAVGAATLLPGTNWFTNAAPVGKTVFYRMRLLTPAAPLIITQPVSQTNEIGATAVFTVTASGYPFPAYQWLFNEADWASGTNATLALPNVQTNQAGSYRVIVTNSYGSVTSQVAVLTVVPPPPRILAGSLVRTNGQFKFTLQSQPGSRFVIQASTNLVNWTNLATVTNVLGTIPFTDTATNFKWRFYRAREQP